MPCFDAFWREEHNGGRVRIEVDVLVGLALRNKIEAAGNKTQLLVISQNHRDALGCHILVAAGASRVGQS